MTAIPRLAIPLSTGALAGMLARLAGGVGRADDVAAFEHAFAARYGRPDAVAFCRARMGLYHLLRNLGLSDGAEVLIGAIHVADFVNIIRLAGFTPVVVDLEPDGFRLDPGDVERKLTARSAVLIATHLSGYVHDLAALRRLCDARGMVLIEDCSQAFAVTFRDRPAGLWGHAAVFSLSLLKSVCALNGGMVIAEDAALVARLRRAAAEQGPARRGGLAAEAVRNLVIKATTQPTVFSLAVLPLLRLTAATGDGFSRYQKTNKTVALRRALPPAFCERFTGAQARLGLALLADLDSREARRKANGRLLRAWIHEDAAVRLPPHCDDGEPGYWLFPLVVAEPARLKAFLAARGIDSSPMLLAALSAEEAFRDLGFTAPNAERTRAHTLFVPMYPGLDEARVRRIADAIAAFQRSG